MSRNLDTIIAEIKKAVQPFYINAQGEPYDDIHDIHHMQRVYGACVKMLALEPNANKGEVLISALLHDIGRSKGGEKVHAAFSYEIAKGLIEPYKDDFVENDIDLEKVLLMVKYHTVAHICPDQNIADSIEFNIFTDADKIDMFGPCGALRVPIATAYHGVPTVYWAIKRLEDESSSDKFQFQSEVGKKIGQKHKDYLKKYIEDIKAQRAEFESEY
jgi:HD superfamily phosphodiesterase